MKTHTQRTEGRVKQRFISDDNERDLLKQAIERKQCVAYVLCVKGKFTQGHKVFQKLAHFAVSSSGLLFSLSSHLVSLWPQLCYRWFSLVGKCAILSQSPPILLFMALGLLGYDHSL